MAKKRKRVIKRSGKINHSLKKSSFRKSFLVVVISLVAVFLLAVGYQSNKSKLDKIEGELGSFAPSSASFGGVDTINCGDKKIEFLNACDPPGDETCVEECEYQFFLCINETVGDTNNHRCPIDAPNPCPESSALTVPQICCRDNEKCEFIMVDEDGLNPHAEYYCSLLY